MTGPYRKNPLLEEMKELQARVNSLEAQLRYNKNSIDSHRQAIAQDRVRMDHLEIANRRRNWDWGMLLYKVTVVSSFISAATTWWLR